MLTRIPHNPKPVTVTTDNICSRGIEWGPMVLNCPVSQPVYNTGRLTHERETCHPSQNLEED